MTCSQEVDAAAMDDHDAGDAGPPIHRLQSQLFDPRDWLESMPIVAYTDGLR